MLLHLFAFFSLTLLLQQHIKAPVSQRVDTLEVRFSQQLPPKINQHLLTRDTPAPFKATQAEAKKIPDTPKPPPPVNATPAPATYGVAMSGAITLPWQMPPHPNNSIPHPAASQQNAERMYYQQAMEAQARQRSEYQSQIMMQQLQQLLAKRLEEHPLVTGKCVLDETSSSASNKLLCDSSALYEVFYKDQQSMSGMIITLRQLGRRINGFTVVNHNNEPVIILNGN